MEYIETVRIVSEKSEGNPFGYVTINKADLTDDHVLFEGEQAPEHVELQHAEVVAADLNAVDPELTGTEPVQLSDNDGHVTPGAKPWEQ